MEFDKKTLIEQLASVGDYMRWGASQFAKAKLSFSHGTDNAWDDALHLVLHTLHLPLDSSATVMHCALTKTERQSVIDLLLQRIIERKPVPYLTRQAWFAGLPFYVDERVIIPRSPLAEIIENEFSPWTDDLEVKNILDLCTGSGCIAIACAQAFPQAHIDAIDINPAALEVAAINVKDYQLSEPITLIESDLFAKLPRRQYDIIISNPPYVDAAAMQALPKEFGYEPRLALAAGENGLDIVKKILQQAPQYLSNDGLLIVEVGMSAAALINAFPTMLFTWLNFERGGEGVFLLTAAQIENYHASK